MATLSVYARILFMGTRVSFFGAFVWLLTLTACRGQVAMTSTENSPRFSMTFVRGTLPFAYDYVRWEASFVSLVPYPPIASVTEHDVVSYSVGGDSAGCVQWTLTEDATSRLVTLRRELFEVPVRVTLDGVQLYVGREYFRHGAAAIAFPVVHRDRLSERVLEVCGALFRRGDVEARRVDPPQLREFFRARNRLNVR
jgi:hypothetical protein